MLSCLVLAAALLSWPPPRRPLPALAIPTGGRWPALGGLVGGPAGAAAVVGGTAAVVSTPLVAALAAACAALLVRAEKGRRRRAETEARLRGLAEALGALAADLRGGRSLDVATSAAIGICADEGSRGALARALRAPVARAPAGDDTGPADVFDRIAAAVALSNRTGCSLAAVLTAVEDDLRARLRHGRALAAAVAGPRASALLLAGLPLLGLAMGSGIGADPWQVLTGTPIGQALLVAGVALEVAGIAWTGRLVRRAVA